jgi:hypothetical protein
LRLDTSSRAPDHFKDRLAWAKQKPETNAKARKNEWPARLAAGPKTGAKA